MAIHQTRTEYRLRDCQALRAGFPCSIRDYLRSWFPKSTFFDAHAWCIVVASKEKCFRPTELPPLDEIVFVQIRCAKFEIVLTVDRRVCRKIESTFASTSSALGSFHS
jgi:hypothetical protein